MAGWINRALGKCDQGLWFGRQGASDALLAERLLVHQGDSPWWRGATPALWLVLVVVAIVLGLTCVGYLVSSEDDKLLTDFDRAIGTDVAFDAIASQRGAFAVSGVLLGITVALTIAALYWTIAAAWGHTLCHLKRSMGVFALSTVVLVALAYGIQFLGAEPYDSAIARHMLDAVAHRSRFPGLASFVPNLMFFLATFVPLVLMLGACFLIEGLRKPRADEGDDQLKILLPRLGELDQMLYLGALTLVAGTLQLAAALSVPLATMPSTSETRTAIDLCKSFKARDVSNPFDYSVKAAPVASVPAVSASEQAAQDARFERGFGPATCQGVATDLKRIAVADSIRQLIHALTLSFGLAFSAMLASIYLPAFLRLRQMVELAREKVKEAGAKDKATVTERSSDPVGEVDPLRRIAATVATLAPLIAGLIANTLTPVG